MKMSIFAFLLLLSTRSFAEDSVVCGGYERTQEDEFVAVVTDRGTLRVSGHREIGTLLRVEITYKGEPKFQVMKVGSKLKNKPLRRVRAVFDNGTSIRRIYEVDFGDFQDGAEIPVHIYNLYPASPNGRLEFVDGIECESYQS